ncbi:MAG: nucleotidyltransferase domain-containing protein [Muribaculaceae bacterium]|nr:nucleotidyltransferase domain-containing protein [Muribaculaceae bacterium]
MCTSKDCISILKDNMPRIRSEFGVTSLCLFGSMARGDNRADSDVDILVDMPPKIFLMSGLKDFLEQILHTSVDLVRRNPRLSSRFLNQVSYDGIKLF